MSNKSNATTTIKTDFDIRSGAQTPTYSKPVPPPPPKPNQK